MCASDDLFGDDPEDPDYEEELEGFEGEVSQVAVALYAFCKSCSSSADKRLLAAAILLFILGVFKCFEKPLALKRARFSSLVSSFHPAPRTKTKNREVELEQYIQEARGFVNNNNDPPALDLDGELDLATHLSIPGKLFVDFAYPYSERLKKLKSFWLLTDKRAYWGLRNGLSNTFILIYSKWPHGSDQNRGLNAYADCFSFLVWWSAVLLPMVPIGLFHSSHKEAYRGSDITVTFLLLYITYLLEISSTLTMTYFRGKWPDVVAQHSLIGFLARNKRHAWLMGIAEFLQVKGLLHQYSAFKPCHSSEDITNLIRHHVKDGWMNYIRDIESYWKFSDIRGHRTLLEFYGCEEILRWSIEKPFDESIIIWHLATDFCYHKSILPDSERMRLCREISNYMMHLLFANPEMLMPGSRRNLFTTAYSELEAVLKGEDLSLVDEKQLAEKIIDKNNSEEGLFIHDAWMLARSLLQLGDDNMWEVLKGVWTEMLCFSAGRCRGYLHAKSLGSGGEYLTFVSLLMEHAGMETFPERQQRLHLRIPREERVNLAKQISVGYSRQQAASPQ
ncbi:hypothetical protein ACP4OV_018380 [Aristida adscensionis]